MARLVASDGRSVGEYLRHTRRLIDDLDSAIHDLSFQHEGGAIVWAADFTEIHAFVLPGEMDQGRSTTEAALDIATLERFFFGSGQSSSPQTVLLPPHRLELRSAETFFQHRALLKFQQLTRRAAEEIRALQLDGRFKELLEALAGNVRGAEARRLNAELLSHLNEHAGALFLTITQSLRTPQGRLRELLQRSRLIDLSSPAALGHAVRQEELDDNLVRDLTTAIYTRRADRAAAQLKRPTPQAELDRLYRSSLSDALAIAYVALANDRLLSGTERRRIQLLTRSEIVLSEVVRYADTVGNPRLSHFVRRATAFRHGIVPATSSIQQRIQDLRQRRRGLELARNTLRQIGAESGGAGRDLHLDRQITRLNELWRDADNLAVATLPWTPPEAPGNDGVVPDLLEIFRNKDRLNTLIREAAARLAADISINNALLGFFETGERGTGAVESFIEKPVAARTRRRSVLVWSKDTISTIALLFYDPIIVGSSSDKEDGSRALRRLLRARLRMDSEDSAADRRSGEADRQPRLVESCLASSYLEAINERWDSALTLADMAVNWPTHLDPTPRHEALYMRAVARRRSEGPRLESMERCIEDLQGAAADLEKHTGIKEDPRYLLQRGICHFGIWEHIDGGKLVDANSPTLTLGWPGLDENYTTATELFERARYLTESGGPPKDSALRLQMDIANARCYAHVSAHGGDERAIRLYVDLLQAMRACGWTEETVPISQLDTLAWTMFLLREQLGNTDALRATAATLARRLPDFDRDAKDKAVINAHLTAIGEALGPPPRLEQPRGLIAIRCTF